jgi:hypothetical protein
VFLVDLGVDLGGRQVLMSEQVPDVGKADTRHAQVRPEAVSQRMHRVRTDASANADLLEPVEDRCNVA